MNFLGGFAKRLACSRMSAERWTSNTLFVFLMVAFSPAMYPTSFVGGFSLEGKRLTVQQASTGSHPMKSHVNTRLWDSVESSELDAPRSMFNATSTLGRNMTTSKDGLENGDRRDSGATRKTNSFPLTRNDYGYGKAAAGTLGDIMERDDDDLGVPPSAKVDFASTMGGKDGLVTTAIQSGTLASRFGIEHPLDRMALTANGNLQRLVSSYYDAPVEVLVRYCEPLSEPDNPMSFPNNIMRYAQPQAKKWVRTVHLAVHNQTFCTAHSEVTVYDPLCVQLVESRQVGLGQLFRYLDILPEFELHNAGPHPAEKGGGFWRDYTLRCAELSCDIHEDFSPDIWDLHPKN